MKIDNFKFLVKKQIQVPPYKGGFTHVLDVEDVDIYREGFFDAYKHFEEGEELHSPYNQLYMEREYILWKEGVDVYTNTYT